jgi:hypothetical protein
LVEELRDRDVDFDSLRERIDTTSVIGRLVFQILAALRSRVSPVLVAPRCTGIPSGNRETSGEQHQRLNSM